MDSAGLFSGLVFLPDACLILDFLPIFTIFSYFLDFFVFFIFLGFSSYFYHFFVFFWICSYFFISFLFFRIFFVFCFVFFHIFGDFLPIEGGLYLVTYLAGNYIWREQNRRERCWRRCKVGGNISAGTKRRERDILFGGVFFLAGTWTVPL